MRVICIDNSNRPNEIPSSHWVEEGEVYTVLSTCKLNVQGGKTGFKLQEINIDKYSPYEYFDSARFNPFLGPVADVALEPEELMAA
jgi:hypothetical protein